MLFSSDDSLRQAQRLATRHEKHQTLSAEQQRREIIDDARELREHQRFREFAFLLFVAPVIAAIVVGIVQWIVVKFVLSGMLESLSR